MAVHSGTDADLADVAPASGRRGLFKATMLAAVVLVAAAGIAWVVWYRPGLGDLKALLAYFNAITEAHPVRTAAVFFAVNLVVTALSLPIEIFFGVAAGALFGLIEGTLIVSFASTLGATLSFLMSRVLMRDFVERHFWHQLDFVNRGMREDGSFYVFSIRLLPLFPFSLTNILMGLTEVSPIRFYVFSQLGMLPATLIYVNAGTQLAGIDRLSDIVSPPLIGTFLVLAVFPWAAKGLVQLMRHRSDHDD
jgi:uncharacterized membrane protein YdjX (TVP38/TMEM64 family)